MMLIALNSGLLLEEGMGTHLEIIKKKKKTMQRFQSVQAKRL